MEISVSYITTKYFDRNSIGWWFWMFKKSQLIKGFQFRILGIHFHVQENNGMQKAIAKARQIMKQKKQNGNTHTHNSR